MAEVTLRVDIDTSQAKAGFDELKRSADGATRQQEGAARKKGTGSGAAKDVAAGVLIGTTIRDQLIAGAAQIGRATAVQADPFASQFQREQAGRETGVGIGGTAAGTIIGGLLGGPVGAALGASIGKAAGDIINETINASQRAEQLVSERTQAGTQGAAVRAAELGITLSDAQLRQQALLEKVRADRVVSQQLRGAAIAREIESLEPSEALRRLSGTNGLIRSRGRSQIIDRYQEVDQLRGF